MKNILIIGNGFDIAHNLKTSYNDFLKFCNKVRDLTTGLFLEIPNNTYLNNEIMMKQLESESILELENYFQTNNEKIIREFISLANKNFWIDYITQNQSTMDEKWSDLEYVIGVVIESLSYYTDHLKDLKEETTIYHKNRKTIKCIIDYLNKHTSTDSDDYQKINMFQRQILEDLNSLTRLLEIYLDTVLSYPIADNLPFFQSKIRFDFILSFNYTKTYEKVYGIKDDEIFNIHGYADSNRNKSENNMVFGIGQVLKDEKGNESNYRNEYIPFQKYYQRIIKKTGNKYKQWLKAEERKNVFIYGHSLEIADGDIIKDFIDSTNSFIYVFYYDQESLNSLVVNLISIFDKDKVIELTNKEQISFISCNDEKEIKNLLKKLQKTEGKNYLMPA